MMQTYQYDVEILHLLVSPGHAYFGRARDGAADVPTTDADRVELSLDRLQRADADRPEATAGAPTMLEDDAAHLLNALDALGVPGPVTFVGHSFGAVVAEAAAWSLPEPRGAALTSCRATLELEFTLRLGSGHPTRRRVRHGGRTDRDRECRLR